MNTPLFRLSLLSLTLAAGFAHAENEAKDNVVLDTVTVKGQATSATHRVTTKRMEETTSTDLKDVIVQRAFYQFRRWQRSVAVGDHPRHGSRPNRL